MNDEELSAILADHRRWLDGAAGGKRADLRWADLRWANLSEANLSEADLRRADLRRADLRWANLREANLSEADLGRASLSDADLRWANLSEADLHRADLRRADLRGADLDYASWPLSCYTMTVRVDARLLRQLVAHVAGLLATNPRLGSAALRAAVTDYAASSHVATWIPPDKVASLYSSFKINNNNKGKGKKKGATP